MKWPWTRAPLTRQKLGVLGERHAARMLRARGLRILEANYRARGGELDLVARDGEVLVFVEVRTRTSVEIMTPLESVDTGKQGRVIRAARQYLRVHKLFECPCRYDIVEVVATPTGQITEINHYPGAFTEA